MKLFKKLAAAVLAAALALTMVGCGGGNSYAMQDELLKLTIDNLTDENETVTHTTKADDLAAALLAAADTAAAQDAYKGMNAENLYIAEAYANKGPTMKRIRPRAQGRAYRIEKRMSHITLVLDER